MLKFPSSVTTIPISSLVPHPSTNPQYDEHVLAIEESDYEEKLNDIGKMNSNLPIIGRTVDNNKENFDNDVDDDDDGDNVDESEGEFEQEAR
ncbi:hypothetical protein AKJ16_DCAP24168 [Drosera capensis]